MSIIGGNKFENFSIPLSCGNRYFILEKNSNQYVITVLVYADGDVIPLFEILKNKPVENTSVRVTNSIPGIYQINDRATGDFLYKVQLGQECSVNFGIKLGQETVVLFSENTIKVNGNTVSNNTFSGTIGVVVKPEDVVIGGEVPKGLQPFLS